MELGQYIFQKYTPGQFEGVSQNSSAESTVARATTLTGGSLGMTRSPGSAFMNGDVTNYQDSGFVIKQDLLNHPPAAFCCVVKQKAGRLSLDAALEPGF